MLVRMFAMPLIAGPRRGFATRQVDAPADFHEGGILRQQRHAEATRKTRNRFRPTVANHRVRCARVMKLAVVDLLRAAVEHIEIAERMKQPRLLELRLRAADAI